MSNHEYQIFLAKAMDFCSKKETCVFDLKKKFVQWKKFSAYQQQIIDYLVENNYINHLRFARAYVHDKWKFNHWGRLKIKYMLSAMAIEAEYIQEALGNIDEDEYTEIIRNELSKKLKSINSGNTADVYAIRQKLYAYGVSKGFESDLLYIISAELVDKELKKK